MIREQDPVTRNFQSFTGCGTSYHNIPNPALSSFGRGYANSSKGRPCAMNMDIKTVASVLESFVKITAIIVGSIWAYWKFVIQREHEPATDLDIDVQFVGEQDNKRIIEITVLLENKSQVRVKYEDFRVVARYLLDGDKVEDGERRIKYQLNFPRTIDQRIGGEKRYFSNVDYMNPKQVFRHRHITYIPVDASFLWVQTKFNSVFKKIVVFKKKVKVDSQRIFRVPR
jgi:hypothetical protein